MNHFSPHHTDVGMERRVLMVCSVVGLLGILSAVTGFVAEATRIKVISYHFCFNSSLV